MPDLPEFMNAPLIACIFILLDLVTGVLKAFSEKNLSSEKLKQGLFHKSAFVFAIALAYTIEYSMLYIDLGFTMPVGIPACVYVCLVEVTSIFENLAVLNPQIRDSKFLELFNITDEIIDGQHVKKD